MVRREVQREITDVRALRALADPVRYRLLNRLMSVGPRTASQCAELVGATPSNCSYHLRELARYGLVERVERPDTGRDGRERPWAATATGFRFGRADATDPATVTANQALAHARVEETARVIHAAVDRMDSLPAEWREAVGLADYGLRISPAELTALGKKLDTLIRPYIALTREGPPDDAELVHLSLSVAPTGDTP